MDLIKIPVDLEDHFTAMRSQEETAYMCSDYLDTFSGRSSVVEEPAGSPSTTSNNGVNEVWREKICEWSYQVVDHFDFNREVVAISLSYLDRFLSTRSCNKKVFQLAAMTALYLAIKLNEPRTLKMSSLVELSRGYFTADHIAAMEEAVLRALEWRMHPPTSLAFVRNLLTLLPPNTVLNGVWHDIMEMSRFLTELSVCDYFFVTHKPSTIAMAAVLNSIKGISEEKFSMSDRTTFLEQVVLVSGLRHDSADVSEVRNMLRQMYTQSTGNDQDDNTMGSEDGRFRPVDNRTDADSPVCVGELDSAERFSSFHEPNHYRYSAPDHVLPSQSSQEPSGYNNFLPQVTSARKTSKTASRTRPGGNN
mmetsp:Transcript_30314/g.69468  ORF Transcript_30314/g.69468 Transcript_30314/m.69468 type:complete len:363 (-) Transcript_30314:666-1754(-)|eukprot:CAMPEP_0113314792 /NCGR_PEP_ID=MMETSP0010_2-20120614/10709_1 /TAXON_ID=216773 ORGANISM="Corethron hystrix, Strain 308" /NCGR_SAMPLE_ID=MMETSP0010_2 /ASSEMBLY_ACC=CAM_ASM_000155 /LENGTH=362 /DNA_ID=CAMNT_0000171145 /DNA_START=58 /DNA_END=1146 /DNA_ORIENTATION=- /assembly_acc=CAM_ASM_000155